MKTIPYVKFLTAAQSIEKNQEIFDLDLTAKKLLDYVLIGASSDSLLTITEAMKLSTLASPATIHRKITLLKNDGWIDTIQKDNNLRNKYLYPTRKSIRFFHKISGLMQSISKSLLILIYCYASALMNGKS